MTNRNMQRETVVGVFNDTASAQRAIEQLKAAGFSGNDIGVLMQNKQGTKDLAETTGTKAGVDAGKGAVTGGVLGGLTGLLVGIGALAIPGIGPVLAAGPLAAALGTAVGATATGAAIGAGAGAIVGALVGLGVPEHEAKLYEQRFNQGGILVTVKSGADRYDKAWQILRGAGAEDIQAGAAQTGSTQNYNTGQTGGQGHIANPGPQHAQEGTQGQAMSGDRMRVPVVEETLNVQKGQRQAGEVEVRKSVVEEQVNVPVQLSHEEVTVTRHAVDRPLQAGEQTLQDGEVIRVPVSEETVDVQKQARVTGEVEINKQRVTEQRTVSDTVRRERVDVGTAGEVAARDSQGTTETYNEGSQSSRRHSSEHNQ